MLKRITINVLNEMTRICKTIQNDTHQGVEVTMKRCKWIVFSGLIIESNGLNP